jgi:hypothetical protein
LGLWVIWVILSPRQNRAFFIGSIAVALIHSAASFTAIPALLLAGMLAGWGCLLGLDDLNDY